MATLRAVTDGITSFVANIGGDLLKPKERRFRYTKEWMRLNYRWVTRYTARQTVVPTVDFFELFPQARDLIITLDVKYGAWNITPFELYLLSCLTLVRHPKRVFEIGTYDGATSFQLAKLNPTTQIYTLNLPPTPDQHFTIGSRFLGTPQESQIVQLLGDSTKFDYSEYYGNMDMVFVDGAHEYDVVRSDSQHALRMLAQDGIIVWDDYINWKGVRRAVEELLPNYPIFHLADTKVAIMVKK